MAVWLQFVRGIGELDMGVPPVMAFDDIASRYDFDLRTGKSETGLKACTFGVHVSMNSDGTEMVSIEEPEEGCGWRLVELRPVSEGTPRLSRNFNRILIRSLLSRIC